MALVTAYYQGHRVEFVQDTDVTTVRTWNVEQNGESFRVREFSGALKGTYVYDLYFVGANGGWRLQESDIRPLDGVARVICDTVYV